MDKGKTVYDLLFEKDLGKWSQEFKKYKIAIKDISKRIEMTEQKYGPYYPEKENLFKAFELTPLEKIKVVIWGESPYWSTQDNGKPVAVGLSFATDKNIKPPPSLKNIYKEINNNFPMFKAPEDGDLSYLTEQGVLLLNQCLCICPDDKKIYMNLWNRFTNIVITIINENVANCIHVLWGKYAEKLSEQIKSREVFVCAHPSPLSAHRGFFGCKHFLKINITLNRQEKTQINFNKDKTLLPTYVENLKK